MSGLNPLSLDLSQNVVAAAEAAFIEAALDLGIPADVLQAQLSIGNLLTATVLAPQNGHDLLEIFGQPVAAQLPPDVRPGETLLLQVRDFAGNQIVVRNLGLYDPQNPVPTAKLELPLAAEPETQSANPPAPIVQEKIAAPVSPASLSREVLLAASIRPALTKTPESAGQNVPPPATPGFRPQIAQPRAVQQSAVQPNVVQRVIRNAADLLKAIRVPDTPFTRTAAAIAQQAPARLPTVLQRLEAALPRETGDARIPTLRTLIAFTARMNPANAETMPAQISAYVSHVIQGAETKIQQLLQAHVQADALVPKEPESQAPLQSRNPLQTQMQTGEPPPRPQAHADAVRIENLPLPVAQSHVAQRSASAEHDLKSLVLSLLRDPQVSRTPTLTQALNETLITLTGTQLNVLSGNAQDPATLSFALPLFYHEGGKPAYLRIGRDAQSRSGKLDADNFHVAFVLDTANLGTVAIDLESTGRTVKVNVKTEQPTAANRFSDTLSSLRTRLEDLRYRVASATAQALKTEKPSASPVHYAQKHAAKGLDIQA